MRFLIQAIVVLTITSICNHAFSQSRFCKQNQFDSKGQKHGYWVSRSALHPDQKIFSGWYNHGNETRRCVYYDSGNPVLKLSYKNDSVMRIRKFNLQGRLQYKGTALWLKNESEMRFCWDGEFSFYDSSRHKIAQVTYIKGVEQDTE